VTKVTLVTCFNAEWQFGRIPSPYIPLNLLCLAACLREQGHEVQIVDQARALTTGRAHDGPRFHFQMAELIGDTCPEVVGFTTMCNTYPQTLRLARHCKELLPTSKIVLGGPQATAVDLATLHHFPWVDAIVRGEADKGFPDLVGLWATGRGAETGIAGLTWRDANGVCHHTESAPLLELDSLPFPAYDLYPVGLAKSSLIPVEAGRGCPFDCTFCSTNLFFSRRYRIKAPARLVAELSHLHDTYGFTNFDLVHDMLTVDKRWVRDFSRMLIAGDYGFTWGCSARVDCVTPDLLEEMAEAGCVGIFFGIETGSQRLQPIVKKKLHTGQVLPTLRSCAELGMKPTASFITGFPDETTEDAMTTLHMALDVLQLSPDTTAQLHLLAPLVGSPLYRDHKGSLNFDGHSSDISLFLLTDDEIETVKNYPEVFSSFYFFPTPYLNRTLTKAVSASLYTSAMFLIALREIGVDLAQVVKGWVNWQAANVNDAMLRQDYYLDRFRVDFVRYLGDNVIPSIVDKAPQLASMIEYYKLKYAVERGEIKEQLVFREFGFDIDRLDQLIRTDVRSWRTVTPQPWGVLLVNLGYSPNSGFMYLQVPMAFRSIEQGDVLEIPDIRGQILSQPKLMIHNKTKHKLFLVDHHLDAETKAGLNMVNLQNGFATEEPAMI
jgi:radical SAM superfamily enzyme YgiQ (UPF0313 family)